MTLLSRILPQFASKKVRWPSIDKKASRAPDGLRRRIMQNNKCSRNKSTELAFLSLMRSVQMHGWRRNSLLPGRPDFVFTGERVAIFVDGCFWHGCKCKQLPKSNRAFWSNKIQTNHTRDRRVTCQLRALGWKVVRVREHRLKKHPASIIARVAYALARLKNASPCQNAESMSPKRIPKLRAKKGGSFNAT